MIPINFAYFIVNWYLITSKQKPSNVIGPLEHEALLKLIIESLDDGRVDIESMV
jgi:hypothetical protein